MDNRFQRHTFHPVEIVTYKGGEWALECAKCDEVIIDEVAWGLLNGEGERTKNPNNPNCTCDELDGDIDPDYTCYSCYEGEWDKWEEGN